jgi:hypothetical protein
MIEKDGLMRVDPTGTTPLAVTSPHISATTTDDDDHQMYHSMQSPTSDGRQSGNYNVDDDSNVRLYFDINRKPSTAPSIKPFTAPSVMPRNFPNNVPNLSSSACPNL